MKFAKLYNSEKFADTEITAITCDSRKVIVGSVYVCINGVSVDGHKFAKSAIENGAVIIITERDLGLDCQIIVENSRKVFAELCANWFSNPQNRIKMIGVTGTNGKTSVSTMIKNILESDGHKVGLIGTIQNMIGNEIMPTNHTTPDSYELFSMLSLMEKSGCDYCVMEVSSHALDQYRVHGIEYEIGIFTNLTQDHLDYHLTMENYLLAKKKLFSSCRTAIINLDDPASEKMIEGEKCVIKTYSNEKVNADYLADNIIYRPDGTVFDLIESSSMTHIKTNIGGKFTSHNALCAAACAIELGVERQKIADSFAKMPYVKGRAEVVPCDKPFTVIIDYAHTPDGLENILKTFAECEKNRLVAVFGCGGDRDKTKRPIMGKIAVSIADRVIVTSDNPRSEEPMDIINDILVGTKDFEDKVEVIENRIEAIKYAIKTAQKGDVIVLAGKGHETYQILKEGTIHLDEREVVAEALAEI